jgi:hypothetical protein
MNEISGFLIVSREFRKKQTAEALVLNPGFDPLPEIAGSAASVFDPGLDLLPERARQPRRQCLFQTLFLSCHLILAA